MTFNESRDRPERVSTCTSLNLRNTYQFTPRFLHASRRAIRFVAQARAWRFPRLVRALAWNRRARGLRIAASAECSRRWSSIDTRRPRAPSSSKSPIWRASDRRDESARVRAVAAVGMKQRGMVERAERAHVNLLRRHSARTSWSRVARQRSRCGFSPDDGDREPCWRVCVRRELLSKIWPYLVAARPDARTNGGNDVCGIWYGIATSTTARPRSPHPRRCPSNRHERPQPRLSGDRRGESARSRPLSR